MSERTGAQCQGVATALCEEPAYEVPVLFHASDACSQDCGSCGREVEDADESFHFCGSCAQEVEDAAHHEELFIILFDDVPVLLHVSEVFFHFRTHCLGLSFQSLLSSRNLWGHVNAQQVFEVDTVTSFPCLS